MDTGYGVDVRAMDVILFFWPAIANCNRSLFSNSRLVPAAFNSINKLVTLHACPTQAIAMTQLLTCALARFGIKIHDGSYQKVVYLKVYLALRSPASLIRLAHGLISCAPLVPVVHVVLLVFLQRLLQWYGAERGDHDGDDVGHVPHIASQPRCEV